MQEAKTSMQLGHKFMRLVHNSPRLMSKDVVRLVSCSMLQ